MDNRGDPFEFDNAKISAFRKYASIGPAEFKDVTLGPNSIYKNLCSVTSPCANLNKGTCKQDASPRRRQREDKTEYPAAIQETNTEDEGLPIREIVKDLEHERRLCYVQNSTQSRLDKFNKYSQFLEETAKERYLYQQQKLIENVQREEQKIVNMLLEDETNKISEREKLTRYYQNLAEVRRKNAAEIAAKEKFRQELNININKTTNIHKEFSNTYIEIINYVKISATNEELKLCLAEEVQRVKVIFAEMEEVIVRCKTSTYSSSDVDRANCILDKLRISRDVIQSLINEFKNKQDEIAKSQANLQLTPAREDPVVVKVNQSPPVQNESAKVITHSTLNKYVSEENFQMYCEITDFLTHYVGSFKELTDNSSLKQFRFDCKKAVNIPVNAISAVSSHHLKDKYDRLYNLLAGKQVKIADNTYLAANKHPQGIAFCVDLLAKKMVLQADLMISSKAESAFCYATIIVSLWTAIPDFGKLFLAYLYKGCPFLVPFNIPKAADQSSEEYYESQGYQYLDGQIEKQDKYLKRMTGLMRLYAAVVITKPKRGQAHPHGIENGWRWLASILKLEPKLDITATMLHTFLDVAGYQMQIVYKKAFKKLILIILTTFMPILKQNDSGGPATRLEVLLQEYQDTGQFKKPSGILPDTFW